MSLSKEIERAVRSYQRTLITHARKSDIVRASDWDEDVCRRERKDLAAHNRDRAHARLVTLLLADAGTEF